MGLIDLNLCIASDGKYLYAFAIAAEYDVNNPDVYGNNPQAIVLLKSVADPQDYYSADWTFVDSIPASNLGYVEGVTISSQCRVDSHGAITLIVSKSGDPSGNTGRVQGIQWTTTSSNTTTQSAVSSEWFIFAGTSSVNWNQGSPATIGIINSQPVLIYVGPDKLLNFAAVNSSKSIQQPTTWNSQPLLNPSKLEMLEYSNGTLYMVGVDSGNMFLATVPLTALGQTPSTSQMTMSNYTLTSSDCVLNGNYSMMSFVDNALFVWCLNDGRQDIYRNNGTHWANPTSSVGSYIDPYNSTGVGRFVGTLSGDVWGYVLYSTAAYEIKYSASIADISVVGDVNIDQGYGVPIPSSSGRSKALSGGAIAGIVVGLVVVVILALLVWRRRKNGDYSGKAT
ncbi:hypothetical protein BGX26_002549 [Mortierella sp. AD094]|nr:hypothetical protein BGX26_002549 [Mortierella sp. AD094]